jgi:hypothetical protein
MLAKHGSHKFKTPLQNRGNGSLGIVSLMMQVDFYLQHFKYFGVKDYKKITSRIENQTHIWQCKKRLR